MFDYDAFADKIKKYRVACNFNQQEFASKLEIELHVLQRIEQKTQKAPVKVIVNFLNLIKTNFAHFTNSADNREIYIKRALENISKLDIAYKNVVVDIITTFCKVNQNENI